MGILNTVAGAALASLLLTGSAFAQSGTEGYPEVCLQADNGTSDQMAPHAGMDMSAMDPHQRAAMEGMMETDRNMMQGMMADDPDVAFVCGMIAHHQGAIVMAEVELEYGDDEAMKQLAEEIIAAQTREIADMKAWLDENAQ
jgi:uncharacterized protein (DUF305 family)